MGTCAPQMDPSSACLTHVAVQPAACLHREKTRHTHRQDYRRRQWAFRQDLRTSHGKARGRSHHREKEDSELHGWRDSSVPTMILCSGEVNRERKGAQNTSRWVRWGP